MKNKVIDANMYQTTVTEIKVAISKRNRSDEIFSKKSSNTPEWL